MNDPQPKSIVFILLIALSPLWVTGQEIHSIGFFSGFSIPYTWDEGINKDPRYRTKYNIKWAPVGFHYGIDKAGFGFTFDPGIFKTGQSFNVINISGGDVGGREIDLTYLHVPAGFKLHIIDLSFFKVSFVASISAAYLIKGEETITHTDSKLWFPTAVYPNLPSDYIVEYDGVIVPNVKDLIVIDYSDFNKFQIYGGLGFRSDWDIKENLRISFDLRGNYGILEPRTKTYIDKIEANEAIYDLQGLRREMMVQLNIGLSYVVEIDPKVIQRKAKVKAPVQRDPVRSKYQDLRNSKPPTKPKRKKN